MTRSGTLILLSSVIGMFAGCAKPRPTVGPPPGPYGFPHSVAVLPLANETLSIEGPKILRVRLRRQMDRAGYSTQKLGHTDVRLREIGVNLGDQIPYVPWEDLRAALGTDAALSGRLINHSAVVTGAINTRTVEAEMVLTDLRTGQILWHKREKVKQVDDVISAAGQTGDSKAGAMICLAGGVLNLISGVAQHDARKESEQLARSLCRTLPRAGWKMDPTSAANTEAPADSPEAPTESPAARATLPPASDRAGAVTLAENRRSGRATADSPSAKTPVQPDESLPHAPEPKGVLPGPPVTDAALGVAPAGAGNGQVESARSRSSGGLPGPLPTPEPPDSEPSSKASKEVNP